jgi:NADH dehydrogenase FAD-containing subunit
MPAQQQQLKPKKRVLVVGAGAAGMACASQLSQSAKFDVTLVDAVVRPSHLLWHTALPMQSRRED